MPGLGLLPRSFAQPQSIRRTARSSSASRLTWTATAIEPSCTQQASHTFIKSTPPKSILRPQICGKGFWERRWRRGIIASCRRQMMTTAELLAEWQAKANAKDNITTPSEAVGQSMTGPLWPDARQRRRAASSWTSPLGT